MDGLESRTELSVVIAAYNAAHTLGEQLESLALQQPAQGWEILVCDNGSTDGTRELVRAWEKDLPALRLLDASARRGPAAARNEGARHATGRSLLFCDADDVVGQGWVRAMQEALRSHTFVAGRLEWQRLNDAELLRARPLPQQGAGLQVSTLIPGLRHAGAGNMGIRRELFLRVGGFCVDAPTLEDTDLCWRVQLAGQPLVEVPEAVVHVRLRPSVRGTVRQAFSYGRGERWLTERFRHLVPRDAIQPLPVLELTATAVAPEAPGLPGPGRLRRVLNRAGVVVTNALHVRGRGDLAALGWTVAWGIGFALGVVAEPPLPEVVDLALSARPDEQRV